MLIEFQFQERINRVNKRNLEKKMINLFNVIIINYCKTIGKMLSNIQNKKII